MQYNDIRTESKIKSSQLTDITYFREKFYIDKDDLYIDDLSITLLIENFAYLKKESVRVSLDKKYYYKPDYLAKDIYGTTNLWFLILYMNNCKSIEEFTLNEIDLPTKESIYEILKYYKPEVEE